MRNPHTTPTAILIFIEICLRKAASRRTPPSPQSEQVDSDPDVGTGAFVFAEEGFEVAFFAPARVDGPQRGQEADRAACFIGAQPGWRRLGDAREQLRDGLAATIGDALQEPGEACFGQPGRGLLGGIAAQERDRDVGVRPGEKPDGVGKTRSSSARGWLTSATWASTSCLRDRDNVRSTPVASLSRLSARGRCPSLASDFTAMRRRRCGSSG